MLALVDSSCFQFHLTLTNIEWKGENLPVGCLLIALHAMFGNHCSSMSPKPQSDRVGDKRGRNDTQSLKDLTLEMRRFDSAVHLISLPRKRK